jgi:hypothetical protein
MSPLQAPAQILHSLWRSTMSAGKLIGSAAFGAAAAFYAKYRLEIRQIRAQSESRFCHFERADPATWPGVRFQASA